MARLPVALALAFLGAAACGRGGEAEARTGPPRRVVSLAPSCTETLIELGLSDRLVGISDYCPDLPAGARAVRVGGLVNLNVEAILKLRPDLVLTVQNDEDRSLATLRRQGVAVWARDPQSLEEVFESIAALAELFQAAERGTSLVADLRARVERVRADDIAARADGPAGAPRVYVEVDHPPCWTIGRRSFVHDALLAAGGVNVFGDVERGYVQVSQEELAARAPDWVLVLHPIEAPLAQRAELSGLDAVKQGRVIADFDRDSLLRSSPRLVRGIELLAKRLRGR